MMDFTSRLTLGRLAGDYLFCYTAQTAQERFTDRAAASHFQVGSMNHLIFRLSREDLCNSWFTAAQHSKRQENIWFIMCVFAGYQLFI